MKARASGLLALILICVLLALPATALATPPEPLTIAVDMWVTGPDSAAGTCTITGLISDSGTCSEVYFMADDTTHGVKTIVGSAGTITIRYQAALSYVLIDDVLTGVANGRWVIVSGTGAYEKLHGVGEAYAELNMNTFALWATYTGTGHFD